ncbi:hypothetical protein DY926_14610 [Komagataeibacter melaceti]|uniref:Uncharacterized protein n=1 Tax=Komagataeibacter melaceti TaxID=2766577 RepID=A0A371YX29_9PROT|nr:hypothetical protein DY926_14610 [Komagataeibacter melaceti]
MQAGHHKVAGLFLFRACPGHQVAMGDEMFYFRLLHGPHMAHRVTPAFSSSRFVTSRDFD